MNFEPEIYLSHPEDTSEGSAHVLICTDFGTLV
jgi:hypothetical protein